MTAPTSRQIQVLWAIHRLTVTLGWPPSLREIGKEIGVASLRGVTVHLDALDTKGLIRRGSGGPRCLAITQEGKAELEAEQMGWPSPLARSLRANALSGSVESERTDTGNVNPMEGAAATSTETPKKTPPRPLPIKTHRGTAPRSLKDFEYPNVGWLGDK